MIKENLRKGKDMMYKLSGKSIDLELVFATEEEAKAQMKKWEADDKEDGIYSDDEYYITEINDLTGKEYEDPDGIWKIIGVEDGRVTVKNIQDGNNNFGKEFCVDYAEVRYYINGGK